MQIAVRSTIALWLCVQIAPPAAAQSCCFVTPTFRDWCDGNNTVVVVQLTPDPKDPTKYQRDAVIVNVIRSRQPLLEGAKTLSLDLPIRGDKPLPPRTMIIFGEHFKGQWDWYAGIDADAEAVRCVKGLLKSSRPISAQRQSA